MEKVIVNCLDSGSNGNCWIIEYKSQILVLECGVDFSMIQRSGLIKSFRNVVGVLCSHNHNDHNKCINNFNLLGIKTYTTNNIKVGECLKIGTFKVLVLPAIHNIECNSFLIKEIETNKTIFFVTDSTYIPNIKDKEYDLFMCEVNYDEDIIRNKSSKNEIKNLGFENHCSLQNIEEYLSKRKYQPKKIIACHISNSGNINTIDIINKLNKYADEVYIAQQKLKIEI